MVKACYEKQLVNHLPDPATAAAVLVEGEGGEKHPSNGLTLNTLTRPPLSSDLNLNSHYKSTNGFMREDDEESMEDEESPFESPFHHMHGTLHANGFGHLQRMNAREETMMDVIISPPTVNTATVEASILPTAAATGGDDANIEDAAPADGDPLNLSSLVTSTELPQEVLIPTSADIARVEASVDIARVEASVDITRVEASVDIARVEASVDTTEPPQDVSMIPEEANMIQAEATASVITTATAPVLPPALAQAAPSAPVPPAPPAPPAAPAESSHYYTSKLQGGQLMEIWDSLCLLLKVRDVSVEDVSNKQGMLLRMLHAVADGDTWYGKWGYVFGRSPFNVTREDYESCLEALRSAKVEDLHADFAGKSLTTHKLNLSLSLLHSLFCYLPFSSLLIDLLSLISIKRC